MKKIFVNGYGSIGSRITSFLKDDPEIQVIGVGKYSADDKVEIANSRGLNVYVPERKLGDFSNCKIAGTIESALDDCDLVIDASPAGHGYKNKKSLYEPKNIPAIYQGGESATGSEAVSDLLLPFLLKPSLLNPFLLYPFLLNPSLSKFIFVSM